jgi:hypothetical protein
MGIRSYTYMGAIVSAALRNKKRIKKRERVIENHPIHTCTMEQHLKWIEEGKCQCCGSESGEYKGICDECRLS